MLCHYFPQPAACFSISLNNLSIISFLFSNNYLSDIIGRMRRRTPFPAFPVCKWSPAFCRLYFLTHYRNHNSEFVFWFIRCAKGHHFWACFQNFSNPVSWHNLPRTIASFFRTEKNHQFSLRLFSDFSDLRRVRTFLACVMIFPDTIFSVHFTLICFLAFHDLKVNNFFRLFFDFYRKTFWRYLPQSASTSRATWAIPGKSRGDLAAIPGRSRAISSPSWGYTLLPHNQPQFSDTTCALILPRLNINFLVYKLTTNLLFVV